MPKPNYQFEKRKKDMEKKAKNEEKRQRKLDKSKAPSAEASGGNGETGTQEP